MANLHHNSETCRYSVDIEGYKAYIDYEFKDGVYALTHTFVPEELRGKGAGKVVLEAVLEELKSKGAKITPVCPFIVTFIKRNPQYGEMVAE